MADTLQSDIDLALRDMLIAKQSHEAWAIHLEFCEKSDFPCEECNSRPYKLSSKDEKLWVQKYERVIKILRDFGRRVG